VTTKQTYDLAVFTSLNDDPGASGFSHVKT